MSSGGAAAGGLERRWPKRVAGLGDVISGRDRDWCAKYHTGKFLQNFCALRAHRQISRKFLRAARAGIFSIRFWEILPWAKRQPQRRAPPYARPLCAVG